MSDCPCGVAAIGLPQPIFAETGVVPEIPYLAGHRKDRWQHVVIGQGSHIGIGETPTAVPTIPIAVTAKPQCTLTSID